MLTNSEGEFLGYRRKDGKVGVRNHVLILPTITCATQTAQRITDLVHGTVSFVHQHGCAQVGVDYEQTFRTYVGMGKNPNVYGVLVIGLGCETHQARSVAGEIAKSGKRVEVLSIQEHGGTLTSIAEGAKKAAQLVQEASAQMREWCDFSELIIGTECGGSDACSGLSANPAVGAVSDMIVERGGTSILAETTELIGAEHLLANRAANDKVRKRVYEVIQAMENRSILMGVDIRTGNPSPGNIAGGLSSLEEKSLGAANKAGKSELKELIDYAEEPTEKGLVWMDTPGHDIEQLTGMVAGGAQIVLFTSGRGTPTGSPIAPVIKIATNTMMFDRMQENMDLNAGTIIEGKETVQDVGRRIFDEIALVSSGKLTKAEILKQHDFGIWRIGPTF
ncbi:UxaA family hydrolase [Schinkia azotoformans]|uniref:UxaA family hydrolase n=1 Tax=Schinkia azotoformans TaxID=1454 RepID=UPI00055392F4|nr:UxaA family hydrolase [Schinkia azotoformans]MEC1694179.1 UxaA family hydrolase [Schinkia azotoformans]MEC1723607.1 UxaA family hydrolase [Schinkia azotoformans]MEC1781479.1 UxaA family hydrolase [Schinkia azotoformans]MED4329431.1 UxaA family hydrolase [Schinkia azotoformans]